MTAKSAKTHGFTCHNHVIIKHSFTCHKHVIITRFIASSIASFCCRWIDDAKLYIFNITHTCESFVFTSKPDPCERPTSQVLPHLQT